MEKFWSPKKGPNPPLGFFHSPLLKFFRFCPPLEHQIRSPSWKFCLAHVWKTISYSFNYRKVKFIAAATIHIWHFWGPFYLVKCGYYSRFGYYSRPATNSDFTVYQFFRSSNVDQIRNFSRTKMFIIVFLTTLGLSKLGNIWILALLNWQNSNFDIFKTQN